MFWFVWVNEKNGLGHNHFLSIKGGRSSDMLMENDSVVLKLHLHVDEKLVPTFRTNTYMGFQVYLFNSSFEQLLFSEEWAKCSCIS